MVIIMFFFQKLKKKTKHTLANPAKWQLSTHKLFFTFNLYSFYYTSKKLSFMFNERNTNGSGDYFYPIMFISFFFFGFFRFTRFFFFLSCL